MKDYGFSLLKLCEASQCVQKFGCLSSLKLMVENYRTAAAVAAGIHSHWGKRIINFKSLKIFPFEFFSLSSFIKRILYVTECNLIKL